MKYLISNYILTFHYHDFPLLFYVVNQVKINYDSYTED